MGCKPSKESGDGNDVIISPSSDSDLGVDTLVGGAGVDGGGGIGGSRDSIDSHIAGNIHTSSSHQNSNDKYDRVYKQLIKSRSVEDPKSVWKKIIQFCENDPKATTYLQYQNPTTKSTPLHIAARLLDNNSDKDDNNNDNQQPSPVLAQQDNMYHELISLIKSLIKTYPTSLSTEDVSGNIPIHYVIAPSHAPHNNSNNSDNEQYIRQVYQKWNVRMDIMKLFILTNPQLVANYLKRNDQNYDDEGQQQQQQDTTTSTNTTTTTTTHMVIGDCSPLYRIIQEIPDDFEPKGVTFQYVDMIASIITDTMMAGVGNQSDGDKPLSLLYRRFTRQFDISEKFFAGDNSRPEVVAHRKKYKIAAANTWKIIEALLRPKTTPAHIHHHQQQQQQTMNTQNNKHFHIVHRAVQVETPPDLLRYIVETNPQDLTQMDHQGNTPLHYAAKSKLPPTAKLALNKIHHPPSPNQPQEQQQQHSNESFPPFYTKYVIDELLYKFPEGAKTKNADGDYPLTLAINSGKQWIGGGIKSLYDAYPDALEQADNTGSSSAAHYLRRALSVVSNDASAAEESVNSNTSADNNDKNNNSNYEDENNNVGRACYADDTTYISATTDCDTTSKKQPLNIIHDEQHDAIMLVQHPDVQISEVIISMWAHEEDAGVQMLGCAAISRLCKNKIDEQHQKRTTENDILRISLSAVAAVVNAMKAHPNEVVVQEKACQSLRFMSCADGKREVSFVASGAVAAIVGAMQAHVSDATVQMESCHAIASIVRYGGPDRATIVASVSGITAILNAIAAHSDAKGVQQYGLQALCELTAFNHNSSNNSNHNTMANLPDLPRSQTAPLLEAAKYKYPHECSEFVTILLSRMK